MEVREQVSALSWKMKSPFHAARAAELWNSFPVGGSGGKRGKELRAEPHRSPRGWAEALQMAALGRTRWLSRLPDLGF